MDKGLDQMRANRYKNQSKDALDRHIRRHPDKYNEGTIFGDIEII